tara:strand:+ start:3475 stop:3696 length:222 start_codon:yes stop_codon:yes gene_type:complete
MINGMKTNTKSTLSSNSKLCTQIIHFSSGEKRTFTDILTENIKQGQFTKLERKDGSMIMINDKNVICIEVFFQ